ncbi:DUF2726 domain-containing protein [Pseudoxanthomonas dokdonensis]|uniref:DUF2726 domain-containing protein n=1 Tax=Pseudoxanthomonas dokdonensis TaxID=344882 RepID=UPI0009FAB845|nr:DUF2726 domain-containing protein [Pseudoxanthomonas dokdonensis]
MTIGWIGFICFLLLIVVLARLGTSRAFSGPWPFYSKKLLTPPEQTLYWRLVKALPAEVVFAQVQLSRFLGVRKGFRFHEWNNRINRLSADFVICGMDGKVLAAIELDDATHLKPERRAADERKNKALAAAGVRLIRWQVSAMPDEQAIHAALHPVEPAQPTTSITPAPSPALNRHWRP